MILALAVLCPVWAAAADASRSQMTDGPAMRLEATASAAAQRAETAGLNAVSGCDALLRGGSGVAGTHDLACVFSPIDRKASARFLALDLGKGATVVVKSGGGDIEAALDMADRMLDLEATIVVWKMCFSSCGNYLFPAARWKIVLPNSALGWHGGPGDPSGHPELSPAEKTAANRRFARSNAFFARARVSPNLIYDTPRGVAITDANRATTAWGLPIDRVEAYGVKGILYYWFPEGPAFGRRRR